MSAAPKADTRIFDDFAPPHLGKQFRVLSFFLSSNNEKKNCERLKEGRVGEGVVIKNTPASGARTQRRFPRKLRRWQGGARSRDG